MRGDKGINQEKNRWNTPLKYIATLNPPVDFSDLSQNDTLTFLPMEKIKFGYFIPNTESFSKFSSSYTAFKEGDILLAKVTPCFENGNIAVAENLVNGKGFGSSELFVVRPKKANGKFLFYYFQSHFFKEDAESSMTGAGGLKRVDTEILKRHKIPLPSIQTQQKIADYLDRETARIDALIEAKEKMLALLEEKRQALISRAVTKGLDPDVKMKDSGIEWLGEIPAHWKVERAKHIFYARDERTETGDEELLTVSHITGVTPRSEKQVYMFEAEDKVGYKKCYPGDLVVNTLWAWMGAMGVAPISGIVSPDYHVYVTNGTLIPEFIDFLCRSKPFVAEVNRWSKGVWSSRLRLYPENFFEIELPIPPSEEQKQIVNYIDTFTEKSLLLSEEIKKSVALLKERKAALISAAVMGEVGGKYGHT